MARVGRRATQIGGTRDARSGTIADLIVATGDADVDRRSLVAANDLAILARNIALVARLALRNAARPVRARLAGALVTV